MIVFLYLKIFAILKIKNHGVMEQNGLQIRNQRTHITLEHYDASLHQTNAYFLLTSVIYWSQISHPWNFLFIIIHNSQGRLL